MSYKRRRFVGAVVLLVALSGCSGGATFPTEPSASFAVGIISQGCEPVSERGVGVLLRDGLVLTSAHVIAGASNIEVMLKGQAHQAQVLAFDPFQDLATLLIQTNQLGTALAEIEPLAPAWILTYDHIENTSAKTPVKVTRRLNATITDIYQQEEVIRQVLEFEGDVEPGDSGSPLVDADGRVGGIVFATASPANTTGYVLDLEPLQAIVAQSNEPLASWGFCD